MWRVASARHTPASSSRHGTTAWVPAGSARRISVSPVAVAGSRSQVRLESTQPSGPDARRQPQAPPSRRETA
ncbi:MAG: hypothetical protein U0325_15595 [Polyangiales bacterium]